jgi:hypothetical protein
MILIEREREREKKRKKKIQTNIIPFDLGHNFDNVKNLAVVFGTQRGLDELGRVNLHFLDPPSQWIETLRSVDMATLQHLQSLRKKREEKELSLGKKLGIAYFYADYTLSSTPDYFAFLYNVEHEWERTKSKWSFVNNPELSSLKIRVVDPEDHSVKHYSSDYISCGLLVPLTCSPLKLFDFIDEKGPETVKKYHEFVKESTKIYNIVDKLIRVFRLRGLTYDSDLPVSYLINCCLRLLQNFQRLELTLEGLRVHIGREYGFREEDGTVIIRWDFKM